MCSIASTKTASFSSRTGVRPLQDRRLPMGAFFMRRLGLFIQVSARHGGSSLLRSSASIGHSPIAFGSLKPDALFCYFTGSMDAPNSEMKLACRP
jgi:hypothetical protein